MSKYLSDVLKASPATVAQAVSAPEVEPVVASGGAGAPAPVLTEGDIQPPKKSPELKPKKVKFSKRVEAALAQKQKECGIKATDALRAVYRRGAASYDASETSSLSRHDWSMTRVDTFIALVQSPALVSSGYTADYDLLPWGHELSTRKNSNYSAELTVTPLAEYEYVTQEEAIFSLAEFSGLGYETIPAIRAAWMRGIKNNENPYERAALLASALYDSPDADLLPKKGIL
jgi:hypothetical protein